MSLVTLEKLNRFYNNHIKSMFSDMDDKIDETEAEITDLSKDIASIENNSFKLSGGTEISDNADLNNYKDIGSYYCDTIIKAQGLINCPTDRAFTMKVVDSVGNSGNNNYKKQIISVYNSSKTYERSFLNDNDNDNVWTEWKRYINTDDKAEIDTRLTANETALLTTSTATGNPISISDSAHINTEELKVELEPIQDLHGYDKPWIGGTGKNLLPLTLENLKASNTVGTWNGNVYTTGSVFTVNMDSDGNVVSIDAKLQSYGDIKVGFTLKAGTYILTSGFNEQYGINDTFLQKDGITIARGNGASPGQMFTLSEDSAITWFFRIYNADNIATPMIRLATETDATFEPYSNICSISGYDETSVMRSGKNLCRFDNATNPDRYALTYSSEAENSIIATKSEIGGRFYARYTMDIKANVQYRISVGDATVGTNQSVNIYIYSDELWGTAIIPNKNVNANQSITFMVDKDYKNAVIGLFALREVVSEINVQNFMISLASETDTSYEPYTADTYTLQFNDTLYGAEVDFVSGVATVKYGYVDLGNLEWIQNGPYFWCYVDGKKYGRINMLSECYKVVSKPYYELEFGEVCGDDVSNAISAYDNRYSSVSDFTNAVTGIKLCYELATPYTIQLTPRQIKMLKGGNNVLTADGDITLEYQVNNALGEVKEWTENKIEDIQEEIDTRLTANETALLTTKSASGNPISISDSAHVNAEELTVELEPKQDLHGYDKPWVGGAGKNKLGILLDAIIPGNNQGTWNNNIYTWRGITFTIETNNEGYITSIHATGSTGEDTSILYFGNRPISEESILSGCPLGGSKSTYRIQIRETNVSWYNDIGNGAILHSGNYDTLSIVIEKNLNNLDLTFYPMIRLATETDPTFEPYSNICPISGYDETSVVRSNYVDLINSELVNGYYAGIDGEFHPVNSGYVATSEPIDIVSGGMYTVSSGKSGIDGAVGFYDSNGNFLNNTIISLATKVLSFTTPLNASKCAITVGSGNSGITIDNVGYIHLVQGIEPYTANIYTLQFGDTVYGAKVDFVSGVATVKYGYESITQVTESSDFRETFTIPIPSNMKITNNDRTIPTNAICNQLQVLSITSVVFGSAIGLAYSTTSGVIFTRFPSSVGTTEADVNNYLASNPIQLCYELTQPYTIQLTPQQIKMLKGNNVLTADGDITLEYQVNNALGEVKEWTENKIEDIQEEIDNIPTQNQSFEIIVEDAMNGTRSCNKTYTEIKSEFDTNGLSNMTFRYINNVDGREHQGIISYNSDDNNEFDFFVPLYDIAASFEIVQFILSSSNILSTKNISLSVSTS